MNGPLVRSDQWIPDKYHDEIMQAAERAVRAGAKEPLRYVGMGATAIVFAAFGTTHVGHFAFKVARLNEASPEFIEWRRHQFRNEFDFLVAAYAESYVKPFIPMPAEFVSGPIVIVKLYVHPRSERLPSSSKLWDIHQRIKSVMMQKGWGGIEFKEDSYVMGDDGPKLVDASAPFRTGWNLARYAEKCIKSKKCVDMQDLAWELQQEASSGRLPQTVADRLCEKLWSR